MPEHRLGGYSNLREEPFRAAPREVEYRLGVAAGRRRIADDRHVVGVLDVEQRARRFLRQPGGHALVDEMHHLLAYRRPASGSGWAAGLCPRQALQHSMCGALRAVAPLDHELARDPDGLRPGRIEEEHRGGGAGIEAFPAHPPQQVAHGHRHIAEIDVHGAGARALVAKGAMVPNVGELVPVPEAHAAAGLLLVEEGLDEKRGRQNLVARAIEEVGARHVRRAYGFALAAAQAVLDGIGDRADVRLLHDERLVSEEVEARRVRIREIAAGQELAQVEPALRVDRLLVGAELHDLSILQEFQFRNADTVLAGDDSIQAAGNAHDAGDRRRGRSQHLVIVRVDGNIRVDVAVTGMHVQRYEDASAQNAPMNVPAGSQNRGENPPVENVLQRRTQLALPRDTDRAVLHHIEDTQSRIVGQPGTQLRHRLATQGLELWQGFLEAGVEMRCEPAPAHADIREQSARLRGPFADDLLIRQIAELGILGTRQRQWRREQGLELIDEGELVGDRQLDVDTLDLVRVFAHAGERQHDVLVDLERVRVPRDRGSPRAVQPEFAPGFRAHGDEPLTAACVGDAYHMGCGRGDGRFIVADDVAEESHLRQRAPLGLGGVAYGPQIPLIHVLEPCETDAAVGGEAIEILLDLDDRRDCIACLAKELETYRARVGGTAVQHPARGSDDAVAAFLLHARQTAQKLVGHVLAEPHLAEPASGYPQRLSAQQGGLVRRLSAVLPDQFELGGLDVVDFPTVVGDAAHFQPVAVAIDHAPPGQVVNRSAP